MRATYTRVYTVVFLQLSTTHAGWSLSRVYCSTRQDLGHFRGSLHSQSLDWYWQTKQQRKIHKLNITQTKQTAKQNYPGSVASYDTRPGNEMGLLYKLPSPDGVTQFNSTKVILNSSLLTMITYTWASLSSYSCRAFTVASPTAWNSLSDDLHDLTLSTDSFRRLLKTSRSFSEY